MDANQYCQEKVARSGSSFYYSFLFLPPPKRQAITALYAFCREVDDVVDECHETHVAETKLAWWRQEIDNTFRQMPQHPVGQALQPAIRNFGLAQERFHDIIDGMEMDLRQNRYADFNALQLYCHRVAGVVGELAATIFGYQQRCTLKYAYQLGLAFQLTNIIRDVGEDARRGRIYLPLDELRQFNVAETNILGAHHTEDFSRLMAFQIERALSHYRQAFEALPSEDRALQRPGLIMAAIYHALLEEIERDGCRVLERRIALTPLRKLWIAWKSALWPSTVG